MIIIIIIMIMMMVMKSILTSTISASCSFYSYTPHFPSSISSLHYLTIHYHHPHHLGVSLADAGLKTLLVSTDPAHSLGDCVSLPLTGSPTLLAPANEMGGAYPGDPSADGASLWGMEINPKEALNEFKVMIKEAMGNAEGAMGGSGGAGGMGAAMGLPDLKQELTNLLDMENLEDTPGV
jgi:anion-transporting  ArsA/GET3 family ATPase